MSVSRSSTSEYWIEDKNRDKLIETVTAVFADELQDVKGFTMTEEKGPETLILVGGLLDIISRVPPDLVGRGDIYLRSVGEATLVIEARDSLSGETIFRAVDRRAAERMGGEMINASCRDDLGGGPAHGRGAGRRVSVTGWSRCTSNRFRTTVTIITLAAIGCGQRVVRPWNY